MKYTITDFRKEFPDDDACLEYIFKKRYPELRGYYRIKNRKSYCNKEGHQIYPLAGTIFAKTRTPLTLWFYAIYLFSVAKNGISAAELRRQLGVTEKCAWRIGHKIRSITKQKLKLSGIVEIDEAFIGGRAKRSNGYKNKSPVIGMVERGGRVKAIVVPHRETHVVLNTIKSHVKRGSHLMTDEFRAYSKTPRFGYRHSSIKHGKGHYVQGNVHTNTIEGFWSHLKRALRGTYHGVSKTHLQSYVNASAFLYNHRKTPFYDLLARV